MRLRHAAELLLLYVAWVEEVSPHLCARCPQVPMLRAHTDGGGRRGQGSLGEMRCSLTCRKVLEVRVDTWMARPIFLLHGGDKGNAVCNDAPTPHPRVRTPHTQRRWDGKVRGRRRGQGGRG